MSSLRFVSRRLKAFWRSLWSPVCEIIYQLDSSVVLVVWLGMNTVSPVRMWMLWKSLKCHGHLFHFKFLVLENRAKPLENMWYFLLNSLDLLSPHVGRTMLLFLPCFSAPFVLVFVCKCCSLFTRKHTRGWNEMALELVGFVRRWLRVYSSRESARSSPSVHPTNCWRAHPFTVAGSPSEEESSTDLGTTPPPAHENQMYSRTPRHPSFVTHQRPEEAGIADYSLGVPHSSLDLFKPAGPRFISAQMIHQLGIFMGNLNTVAELLSLVWEWCSSCDTVLMIKTVLCGQI